MDGELQRGPRGSSAVPLDPQRSVFCERDSLSHERVPGPIGGRNRLHNEPRRAVFIERVALDLRQRGREGKAKRVNGAVGCDAIGELGTIEDPDDPPVRVLDLRDTPSQRLTIAMRSWS